jgi:hypothetical protein
VFEDNGLSHNIGKTTMPVKAASEPGFFNHKGHKGHKENHLTFVFFLCVLCGLCGASFDCGQSRIMMPSTKAATPVGNCHEKRIRN